VIVTHQARLVAASSTEDRLSDFRCTGRKKDGQGCNKLLLQMHADALRSGRTIRIKCKDCNAMNVVSGSTAA
jgi:phage FluMu protein Com